MSDNVGVSISRFVGVMVDPEKNVAIVGSATVGSGSGGGGGGSGAPTNATYLTATSNASLSAEVVVGATPGGELAGTGSTWASPVVADSHAGSTHATVQAAAESTASAALSSHNSATTSVHGISNTANLETTSGAQAKADAKVADAINNGTTTVAPSQNAVYDALALKVNLSSVGAANGVAELDSSGLVPLSQVPGAFLDPDPYANVGSFPGTGATDKLYIDLSTGDQYVWDGAGYALVGGGVGLGETATTAYRGDRGKTAYDHSQTGGNPHGTELSDLGAGFLAIADEAYQVPYAGDVAGNDVGTALDNIQADLDAGLLPSNGVTVKPGPEGLVDRKAIPNSTNRGAVKGAVIGRTATTETEQVKWSAFQATGNGELTAGNPLDLSLQALPNYPWVRGLIARIHTTAEAPSDVKVACGTYVLGDEDVFSDAGSSTGCVFWTETYFAYLDDFMSKMAATWDGNPYFRAIHFDGPHIGSYNEPFQRASAEPKTLFNALDAGYTDALNRTAWTRGLEIYAKHWKQTKVLFAVNPYQKVIPITRVPDSGGGVTATATRSGSTVTVTCSSAHGLSNGDPTFVYCPTNSALDGRAGGGSSNTPPEIDITVTGSTTFTYTTPTSGTVTSTSVRVGRVQFDMIDTFEVMWEAQSILGRSRLVPTNHSIRAGTVSPVKTVTAGSRAVSGVATLTSAGHGYTVGTSVTVDVADANYNGTFDITAVTTDTFSYQTTFLSTDASSGTGTVTKNRKVSGTVAAGATFIPITEGSAYTASALVFPTVSDNRMLIVRAGPGAGQVRRIVANGTGDFTVDRPLTTQLTSASRIQVYKSPSETLGVMYQGITDAFHALDVEWFGFQTSVQGSIVDEGCVLGWAERFGAQYCELNTNYDSDPWDATMMGEASAGFDLNIGARRRIGSREVLYEGSTTATAGTSTLVDTAAAPFTTTNFPDAPSSGSTAVLNGMLLVITGAGNDAYPNVKRIESNTTTTLTLWNSWTATASNAYVAKPTGTITYQIIDPLWYGAGTADIACGEVQIAKGFGSPEASRYGSIGDMYVDVGTGKLYVKSSGTMNSGWTEK